MKKKCVVWGTRAAGKELAQQALVCGYDVIAYCSSTAASQGTEIGDKKVISPEELKQFCLTGEIDAILLGMNSVEHLKEIEDVIRREFPPYVKAIYPSEIENEYLIYVRNHMQYCWNIEYERQAKIWLENFQEEVAFWITKVVTPGSLHHSDYRWRLKNEKFLGLNGSPRMPGSELVEALKSDSVVMDIGCGLQSIYGSRLPNSETIQLIAVDPLAPIYNQINRKYANGNFRTSQFGMFEFAANFFKENYCDAILINNALDHCIDPYKSIVECLYVLKKGGTMRLWHARAEGINEAYCGLYKWNVDYNDENEFVIWNKENSVNISQKLKEIASIHVIHTDDGIPRDQQSVTVEIVKRRDFQLQDFFDMTKESRQLAFLVEGLMTWIAEHCNEFLGF